MAEDYFVYKYIPRGGYRPMDEAGADDPICK